VRGDVSASYYTLAPMHVATSIHAAHTQDAWLATHHERRVDVQQHLSFDLLRCGFPDSSVLCLLCCTRCVLLQAAVIAAS
jgi:hypothetical protein